MYLLMLADLLPAHKNGVGLGWGGVLTYMTRCCYLPLHVAAYVMLRSVHARGSVRVWRSVHGRGSVRVHTGGIDAYWTLLKSAVPNSITSTVGGKPNKSLWMYMRSQQWRWECHDKDLLAFTGQTLAKLWVGKKGCVYPTRFRTQNTVRVDETSEFLKNLRDPSA